MRLLIKRLMAVLIIFCFLQIPFFMMQYMNHLEGHLEELKLYKQELVEMAEKNKLSLDAYVKHFDTHSDPVVLSQGTVMQTRLERLEDFSAALAAYQKAAPWTRPFSFFRHFDKALAKETLSSFQIGFNLSLESLCYIAAGFLVALLISNPFRVRVKHDKV